VDPDEANIKALEKKIQKKIHDLGMPAYLHRVPGAWGGNRCDPDAGNIYKLFFVWFPLELLKKYCTLNLNNNERLRMLSKGIKDRKVMTWETAHDEDE
jgi:hypothetical protein